MGKKSVKISKEVLDIVMRTEMDSDEFQSFKELSAKKNETATKFNITKQAQTSGNKGLRIIGVMRDIIYNQKEPIGYILFNDAKKEHNAYSAEQVKMILGMYTLVNAKLEDNKVVITDGAETALLQFDAYRNPIGTPTVYVLDRARETIRANGQSKQQDVVTFIDGNLTISKLPAETLIDAKANNKINIANMKVVTAGTDKPFLEAKNMTTIPTYEKEIKPEQVKTDSAEKFRKQQLKLKNHASFVQRIVDVINQCVVVETAVKGTEYGTYIKVPGLSQLYRGLDIVGIQGLKAIMQKEVAPVLVGKYSAAISKNEANPISSSKYNTAIHCILQALDTAESVGITLEKIKATLVGTTNLESRLDNPVILKFCTYLYVLRNVDGVYKHVNAYELLQYYNKANNGYKEPYIVNSDYALHKVYEYMICSGQTANKLPSWKVFKKTINAVEYALMHENRQLNTVERIVGKGFSLSGRIIWPLPFKANADEAMQRLSTLPDNMKAYIPLFLHICSELAIYDTCADTISAEEYTYRINRIRVMYVTFALACFLNNGRKLFSSDVINTLSFCMNSCGNCDIPIEKIGHMYNFITKYMSTPEVVNNINNILAYARCGGLFFPYYSPKNKEALTSYMHWEFLFTSLRNNYCIRSFIKNTLTDEQKVIVKKHKNGTCYLIASIMEKLNMPVEYTITDNFKYADKLRELSKRCKERIYYDSLSSNFSRAAVAQYLGRPYRAAKSNAFHARTTRLIYYMNTHSPKLKNKTHELY